MRRYTRSTNTLSRHPPLPSIDSRMPGPGTVSVNAPAVNRLPDRRSRSPAVFRMCCKPAFHGKTCLRSQVSAAARHADGGYETGRPQAYGGGQIWRGFVGCVSTPKRFGMPIRYAVQLETTRENGWIDRREISRVTTLKWPRREYIPPRPLHYAQYVLMLDHLHRHRPREIEILTVVGAHLD